LAQGRGEDIAVELYGVLLACRWRCGESGVFFEYRA
jgi:hypothetical protein